MLHVPDAPNCLLSIPRIDEAQGHVEMQKGECIIKEKKWNYYWEGQSIWKTVHTGGKDKIPKPRKG